MAYGNRILCVVLLASMLSCLQLYLTPRATAAQPCLDVALVLSVDSSASVSPEEFDLQQKGIAAAFRDDGVREAIRAAGQLAVAVIFWGSDGLPKPQSRWMRTDSPESAEAFARMVEAMPRQVSGDTGLGAGLLAALEKFGSLDACALRKVVNVSGDGEQTRISRRVNRYPAPPMVRDLAQAHNVEINALAVSNEEEDLAEYYETQVITGPEAFVMEVRSYAGFAQALRHKLIREIGPRAVSLHGSPSGVPTALN